jgi:hypothetical protein
MMTKNQLVLDIYALLASLDLERLFPSPRRIEIAPDLHLQGMWKKLICGFAAGSAGRAG